MVDPFADLIPQTEAGQGRVINLPASPQPTPVTQYSIPRRVFGGKQGDELYDSGTARGVGSSENELTPGVVAVNPSVYPIGTIFKDGDTNEVFIAGDKHGNDNPNVVDIYTPPSQYKGISGTRNIVPIGQIPASRIPKTASGIGELLSNYGKVPEGEGAYTSLGKTQPKQEDPFADLIPQEQATNAHAQQQESDLFSDLIPQPQGQAQATPAKPQIPESNIPTITATKPLGIMEQLGRAMSPLLGPTESQRFEEAVPVDRNLSEQQNIANALQGIVPKNATYEYKPYANRLEREQGLFTPFVEEIPQFQPNPNDPLAIAAGKGILNAAAGLAGSFMSPGGVLLGGAPKELEAAAGGIKQIQRGAAGLFSGQMLSGIPEQVSQAANPNLTTQQRVQAGTEAIFGAGFGGLAGKHAIFGEAKPKTPLEEPPPEVAPSSNPEVNKKEEQINAMADSQFAPIEQAPLQPVFQEKAPAPAPAADLNALLAEQLFLDEGSPEYAAIQAQIDQLKAGEAPAPAEVATEEKPAEAPAEAQPTTPNAIQEPSAREVGVRNAPAVGEGVGAENKSEVTTEEGQATKEEVKSSLPEQTQSDFIDFARKTGKLTKAQARKALAEYEKAGNIQIGENGEMLFTKPENATRESLRKAAGIEEAPKASPSQPIRDVLRRFQSGEEDGIDTLQGLSDAVSDAAKKTKSKVLADLASEIQDVADRGVEIEDAGDLVQRTLARMEIEANNLEAPKGEKIAKQKTAKDKAREVFGEAVNGPLGYVLEKKILDPIEYRKRIKAGIIEGGGEYDFFYNNKLPKKVRDLIFSKTGKADIDIVAEDAGFKSPYDMLVAIDEAYRNAEKAKEEAKAIEKEQAELEEHFRKMAELEKIDPEAHAGAVESDVRKFLTNSESGYFTLPEVIYDAAVSVGRSVAKGARDFKSWSGEMVNRLGDGIRNFLRQIYNAVSTGGGRFLERGAERGAVDIGGEERFKPKPPTEQEAFAKKAADAFLNGRGTPITEEEMASVLARKFPGISQGEISDLFATASGKPKAPVPYAGVAAGGEEKQGVGISKEAVNNQRLSRMVESLPESERQSNAKKINDALEKNKNPNFVEGLVHDILDMGKTLATPEEVALMTVEMNRLQLERQRVQDNFEQTEKRPSDYSILNSEIKPIDDKIDRLERAVDKVGTNAGRLLQMFKIMLAEDYSPIALEKKAERQLRRELTPEEKNTIAEQARQIKELQDKLNNKQAKAEDTALNQSVKEAYERQIAELKEQSKPDPAVQRILEKVADVLKSPADKARERIAQRRKERGGRLFTGVDPERLADIADAVIIGAEKIAKGASNLAKWTSQMRSEFGDGIMPYIKEIWSKSLDQFKAASEKITSKAPEKVKAKVKRAAKEETTRGDIIDRAKAEAAASEELSHATVYDLARSHILDGMRGEDNIMKAVHDDIKEAYPNASERDVRRAFSEYGKAKFPSKEEDKVQLRQLRTLVRLQESIDRLKDGLPALRSGLQRDRANQAIREKQTILNNLLKEVKLEPTEEELTSRLEAKKNALRNRIEDLDAKLQGKAKPIEKGTTVPLDAEAERLTSLRDAMQQKLREVEAEERKSKEKTPEQKYNERRIKDANKKIAEIEDKMRRGDYSKSEKRKPPVKYPETELVEKQLADKRREADLWREEKEKSERPIWEKALRATSETAREATVAGINVLYKIGKYAIIKPITTPIGEIAGYTAKQLGGLGKVRGEFESGASPLKTIPAYYRGYWKAMKQFMRVLKSGHSDSELLYDKKKQNNTNWFRFIGSNLHAASKNLPSTAKEELYREHLYANAIADGLIDPKNPSDPKNQMAIAGLNLKAYLASKAEKLQEDNWLAEKINEGHKWAESPDKEGKINPYTSLTSHLFKIAITKGIYKIGLNYLKQAGQAATGLPRGMVSLLNAHWKGLDTLTPKEMDYITKAFKVGSLPAALMTWAIIDAFKDDKDKVFGGYYEQGRKKGDVKWGEVRVNGKQFSLHVPEIEAAQFANTMARHFIKNASKTDLGMNALESFLGAMGGVFAEAPITGPVAQIVKSPKSAASYIVQGFVPSASRDIAKMQDVNAEGEVVSRYPRTSLESLQKGIPGLRQKLPTKPQRSGRGGKPSGLGGLGGFGKFKGLQ